MLVLAEKYEDIAGTVLPPETQPFLDAWKRPEDLVLNNPNVPMLITTPAAGSDQPAGGKDAKGAKGAPPPVSRDVEGVMFAGHKSFEWLQGVLYAVLAAKVGACTRPLSACSAHERVAAGCMRSSCGLHARHATRPAAVGHHSRPAWFSLAASTMKV